MLIKSLRIYKNIFAVILIFTLVLSTSCQTKSNKNTPNKNNISSSSISGLQSDNSMKLIATEGKGSLYDKEGNLVLVLRGTPYEMGFQHGVLLKNYVRTVVESAVYECNKKKPGYLENILQAQINHIPQRFIDEMKGLADGAELSIREVQLANVMPELFHCSGIALFGDATKTGELLHSRILDYIVDYGLQDNSVVIVQQPDNYHSFINASFAGCIGSVTGMNDQQIAIGEMGGGGEGQWDGVPMSFLVRMVLEETSSVKQSVKIFKKNDRTCEYYYAISDGKSKDAVAIYASSSTLFTLGPGKKHPLLPKKPQKHTLIISEEDRFLEIHRKVEENYGNIDKDILIEIMKRPVSMKSNLHNAIFTPQSLTMWLAVAKDPSLDKFQACYQTYYEYNLAHILNY